MNITEQLHYAMKRYACMAGAILVGIFGVFEVGAGRKIPRIFAHFLQNVLNRKITKLFPINRTKHRRKVITEPPETF